MKSFKLVATGGTFDILHDGHLALLTKSFQIGKCVIIGVTSDEFVAKKKPRRKILHSYRARVKHLENTISQKFGHVNYVVKKLNDIHGPTVLSSLTEAIVTSEESKPNAEEINKLRTRNGLEPLKIFIVPTVKSEDGLKISSSRIRAGLIDKKGKVTIAK